MAQNTCSPYITCVEMKYCTHQTLFADEHKYSCRKVRLKAIRCCLPHSSRRSRRGAVRKRVHTMPCCRGCWQSKKFTRTRTSEPQHPSWLECRALACRTRSNFAVYDTLRASRFLLGFHLQARWLFLKPHHLYCCQAAATECSKQSKQAPERSCPTGADIDKWRLFKIPFLRFGQF